jgi:hypothetical protein
MCTAVWGGNDENKEIEGKHVTGGDVMAKIWKDYAKQYYESHPTPGGVFFAPTQPTKEDSEHEQKKKDDGALAQEKPAAPPAVRAQPAVVKVNVGNGIVELHGQSAQEDKPKTSDESKTEDGNGIARINPLLPQTAPPATLPTPVYAPAPSPHAHAGGQSPTLMMKMPAAESPAAPAEAVGLHAKSGMQSLGAPNRLYPANSTSQFRPASPTGTVPPSETSQ